VESDRAPGGGDPRECLPGWGAERERDPGLARGWGTLRPGVGTTPASVRQWYGWYLVQTRVRRTVLAVRTSAYD
jgi:hypothetical protein